MPDQPEFRPVGIHREDGGFVTQKSVPTCIHCSKLLAPDEIVHILAAPIGNPEDQKMIGPLIKVINPNSSPTFPEYISLSEITLATSIASQLSPEQYEQFLQTVDLFEIKQLLEREIDVINRVAEIVTKNYHLLYHHADQAQALATQVLEAEEGTDHLVKQALSESDEYLRSSILLQVWYLQSLRDAQQPFNGVDFVPALDAMIVLIDRKARTEQLLQETLSHLE